MGISGWPIKLYWWKQFPGRIWPQPVSLLTCVVPRMCSISHFELWTFLKTSGLKRFRQRAAILKFWSWEVLYAGNFFTKNWDFPPVSAWPVSLSTFWSPAVTLSDNSGDFNFHLQPRCAELVQSTCSGSNSTGWLACGFSGRGGGWMPPLKE